MVAPFHKPIVCPVLIDRVDELATLYTLIDQANSDQGRVALLSGEAGVGKSRLVAEAKAYAATKGFLLFQGNCFQTDVSYPYAPLLDLLRSSAANQLAAIIASDLTPFARELHQLLPDVVPVPPDQAPLAPSDPVQEKHRLFTALAHFFTSRYQPGISPLPGAALYRDRISASGTSTIIADLSQRRSASEPQAFPGAGGSSTPGSGNLARTSHTQQYRCNVPCDLCPL